MRENTDQNNSEYGHFSRSVDCMFRKNGADYYFGPFFEQEKDEPNSFFRKKQLKKEEAVIILERRVHF